MTKPTVPVHLLLLCPAVLALLAGCGRTPQANTAQRLTPLGAQALASGGVYEVLSTCDASKGLDIDRQNQDNGAPLQLYSAGGRPNQQFTFEDQGSGDYKITARHSGKVLDVENAGTANGARVQQWAWLAADHQLWNLVALGNDTFELHPKHAPNQLLDLAGARTDDRTPVQLWQKTGSCAQRWTLRAVGGDTPGPGGATDAGPRKRGAMLSPDVTADDLRVLGGWGANLARYPLLWNASWSAGGDASPADTASLDDYNRWLDSALLRLDALLPAFQAAGLQVVIDLHTPPGGRNSATSLHRLLDSTSDPAKADDLQQAVRAQQAFVQVWSTIAAHYHDNPVVWGFDLLNEPGEGYIGAPLLTWQQLATKAALAVRAQDHDQQHTIVVESPWGDPALLTDDHLSPLPAAAGTVAYSAHIYTPSQYVFQGLWNAADPVLTYPGSVNGVPWNKAQLRSALHAMRAYQQAHQVPIYVGEFSTVRWAPGAASYLSDLTDIFEEYGWDWTYHAFRESGVWDVELAADRAATTRSATPTDRQQVLQRAFARNVK